MSPVNLFRRDGNRAIVLEDKPFSSEKELQAFFEANLLEIVGVHFLATEYWTGPPYNGRIDTLGLDTDGRPVVIEYKRDKDGNVIGQGLDYLRWLTVNESGFRQLVVKSLNSEHVSDICWSPRLLIVAGDFHTYQLNAAKVVTSVELLRFRRFGEDGLLLDWGTGKARQSTSSLPGSQPAFEPGLAMSRGFALPDLGEFRFEGRMSDEAWALFRQLLAFVQTLGHFRLDGLKTFLAFRKDGKPVWPAFATVRPDDRSKIRIDVLECTQSRPTEKGFTSVDRSYRIIHIRSCADLEKAKPLLRDAWEKS